MVCLSAMQVKPPMSLKAVLFHEKPIDEDGRFFLDGTA
jgi:hypothetical protein